MAKENNKIENVVNPFDEGVDYKVFLEALGSNKIEDYLKDVCSKEQIQWLVEDLKNYKQK